MFRARNIKSPSEEEGRLPFGGVLLPFDANLSWPPDMEYLGDNASDVEELKGEKPSLRFACSFVLSLLEDWRIVITSKTSNPFNWPAVVFIPDMEHSGEPEWLEEYNRNQGYFGAVELDPVTNYGYEDYINNILAGLGAIISLQQSAMRYLQYYGVPVENIVSKYLELAKSIPSDGYATEAPPTDVYIYPLMSRGRPKLLGYDLSTPIKAAEFLAIIDALKKHYKAEELADLPADYIEKLEELFLEIVIPLPASNDLQSLLRLGDLYIQPSELVVGVASVKATINPKAVKIIKPKKNNVEPYELAIAILALLDKPLTTVYNSIPREMPKEAKVQAHKASRRIKAYETMKSQKDAS